MKLIIFFSLEERVICDFSFTHLLKLKHKHSVQFPHKANLDHELNLIACLFSCPFKCLNIKSLLTCFVIAGNRFFASWKKIHYLKKIISFLFHEHMPTFQWNLNWHNTKLPIRHCHALQKYLIRFSVQHFKIKATLTGNFLIFKDKYFIILNLIRFDDTPLQWQTYLTIKSKLLNKITGPPCCFLVFASYNNDKDKLEK